MPSGEIWMEIGYFVRLGIVAVKKYKWVILGIVTGVAVLFFI